jgi:hypothetical protein
MSQLDMLFETENEVAIRSIPTVHSVVERLKEAEQDHEFYPTTDEIIQAMVRDIKAKEDWTEHYERRAFMSVLDIGAGNGKVLLALRKATDLHDLHAIEKSSILCRDLDPDILVVGTEFAEQSLLSKEVDVIFCNPPYSQFVEWTEKIIRQSCCSVIYLVLPQRWESSVQIKDALKFRDVDAHNIGSFDFEDAEDRKARAKVHLLRIAFGSRRENDAFERFFEEQFADLIAKFESKKKKEGEEDDEEKREEAERPFKALVPGPNYPDAMVNLYRQEMAHVEANYHLVSQLDSDLLRELEISPAKIMEFLKKRLSGLRNEYWMELFTRLNTITERLTAASRKKMLDTLHKHVAVDFTVSNIYEVVIWVIKNANRYIESQLVDVYQVMVDKCNVQLYKSNKRTWEGDGWRYNGDPEKNSHYALDYRIVTHRVGGIRYSCLGSDKSGLEDAGIDFLGDLLTIAGNLGFNSRPNERSGYLSWRGYNDPTWKPGAPNTFHTLKGESLIEARAFKNRNMHLRLNQKFILALNVEYGRLRGWLHSGEQAAEELQDPEAASYFHSNTQIGSDNPTLLLTN